jgi:hypothetical protein
MDGNEGAIGRTIARGFSLPEIPSDEQSLSNLFCMVLNLNKPVKDLRNQISDVRELVVLSNLVGMMDLHPLPTHVTSNGRHTYRYIRSRS